ncbi:hypothetical protein D3C80_1889220 [compost metagenome]
MDLFGEPFALLDQAQYLQAALVIGRAELGQALAAGGAIDQADPEALLQGAQVIAHHGGRQAALAGGGGHAAGLDHAHVNRHRQE